MLIPRSVSHHRPSVRDDQPFQYDTNDWFSIENESLLLKAGAGETHPFLDRFQDSHMGENLSQDCNFPHPGRN